METNPSNIRIFHTDIRFIAAWWYYANGLYWCCRMLDGLVSSHPVSYACKLFMKLTPGVIGWEVHGVERPALPGVLAQVVDDVRPEDEPGALLNLWPVL